MYKKEQKQQQSSKWFIHVGILNDNSKNYISNSVIYNIFGQMVNKRK